MKKLMWFLAGVATGFVAAHFLNKDPRGHEVLSSIDATLTEFTERVGEAYTAEEQRRAGGDRLRLVTAD